jgi:tight adherence protein C
MALALIAAVIAFAGVVMIVTSLAGRTEHPVRARVRGLAARLPEEEPITLGEPFVQRVVWPVLDGISNTFSRVLPTAFVARVDSLLTLAGQPLSLPAYLSTLVLTALALPGLVFALMLAAGTEIETLHVLGLLLLGGLGFYLPYFWLARRVGRRQNEVLKSLPNALDLITTCVEAGLGLDSAFAKVAERLPGPFGEELEQGLRDMSLGRGRHESLRAVADRTGVSEVKTFIGSIIHAETTGSSVGDVLRVQADQMRTRRRQRVEQIAQKIPIWMTFPLVMFLLPSLFIAILGPAAIEVINALG